MELDRGVLARIDRKLLAGLGRDATFHMVRVPVPAAKWSTWKRYCDAAGLSMGRAIHALIDRELASVFGESGDEDIPMFAAEAEEKLAARETAIADREDRLRAEEKRLGECGDRLRLWDDKLRRREQSAELVAKLAMRPRALSSKIGRNERCPCGSGLKYKHCDGLPGGPGWLRRMRLSWGSTGGEGALLAGIMRCRHSTSIRWNEPRGEAREQHRR